MNNKSSEVICVGELLIDFFCTDVDVNLVDGRNFEKQAGGAPANVCAAISRLGGESAFVGKVGNDPFGLFLKKTLDDEQVDTSMLTLTNQAPTTLAFVSLQAGGERDFIFNRGADQLLTDQDLNMKRINGAKIMHFGSATALLNNPFQQTYLQLIEVAREQDTFVSFDPNYRSALWPDRTDDFISISKACIANADFVKVSEEELEILSGTKDRKLALKALHELGAKLIAVTLGKEGTLISNGQSQEIVSSISVKSIDSTGAGDAFVGAILHLFSQIESPRDAITDFEQLKEMVTFANRVGAFVCTKLGAISALPRIEDIQ